MNRLRSRLVQMSPKSKQICVVVGAAAALFFVIWLFQGEPEKRVVYDKKKDQVANVLTDRSNRNVGLDRMAGQIRRLEAECDIVPEGAEVTYGEIDNHLVPSNLEMELFSSKINLCENFTQNASKEKIILASCNLRQC